MYYWCKLKNDDEEACGYVEDAVVDAITYVYDKFWKITEVGHAISEDYTRLREIKDG